jgi:hypothetical protein
LRVALEGGLRKALYFCQGIVFAGIPLAGL